MVPTVVALRLHARRVAAFWFADPAEPAQTARVRARIVVVLTTSWAVLLLGVGPTGAGATEPLATGLYWAGIALPLGFAAFAVSRGSRLGDLPFTITMCAGFLCSTATVHLLAGPGQLTRTSSVCVIGSVMSAVFIERRRHLFASLAFMGALLTLTAWQDQSALRVLDIRSTLLAQGSVVATVRSLRQRSLTAVRIARRNEVTDPLTALSNRRGLERSGAGHWRRTAQRGLPMAALVIDVDHFKDINDRSGHAAGDEVLRRLGHLLSSQIRQDDVAVRLGGEEFLLLCATHTGGAQAVAERLRVIIERELAPITVSIGVHEAAPDEADAVPETIWAAVDRADQVLYIAKNTGRNRVVLSP